MGLKTTCYLGRRTLSPCMKESHRAHPHTCVHQDVQLRCRGGHHLDGGRISLPSTGHNIPEKQHYAGRWIQNLPRANVKPATGNDCVTQLKLEATPGGATAQDNDITTLVGASSYQTWQIPGGAWYFHLSGPPSSFCNYAHFLESSRRWRTPQSLQRGISAKFSTERKKFGIILRRERSYRGSYSFHAL